MFLSIKEILHEHDFGEWIETNKHAWSHAKTLYRTCKTCYEDEYRLIELNCPQYKIKGKNCHWCERYEEEWQRRLKNMTFDGVLDAGAIVTYNQLMKQIKKGVTPETMVDRNKELYKFILEGHTFAQAGEKFDISRARAYELYKKFDKKMEKVA